MNEWSAEPTRPGLVRPVRRDPTGRTGPTKAAARRWRRTSRGFYVPASVDPRRPEQRIIEVATMAPRLSGVTGWAALRWLGAEWFSGTDHDGALLPIVLMAGDARARNQPGIVISQERRTPRDLLVVDGVPITLPDHAACFEARYAGSLAESVIVWDMAAFADLVSGDEAAEICARHASFTGIPRARQALALACENSWSPMETRLRLAWIANPRRPAPLANTPIFDRAGQHLGTPDLIDPVTGVIGEYDGHLHLEGSRRAADIVREGIFRDHGLECFTVVAGDLSVRGRVAARIDAAYARARPQPPAQRRWTITPPPWWAPTTTVADRRRLALEGRSHLLPNRKRDVA